MLRLPGSAGQAEAMVSIVEVAEESSGREGKDNAKANWSYNSNSLRNNVSLNLSLESNSSKPP